MKIGDWIKFKSPTRAGNKSAVRKINGFKGDKPTVKFNGWSNFIILPNEIIDTW